MKKIFIFLICLTSLYKSKGQTVFAPPNAVWHYEYTKDLDPPGLNYTRQEVEKDTVYEGVLCSKVIGKRISINAKSNGYDTLILAPQYLYTSGDTVFYYNKDFTHFYPLYIFNVKVGDTVTYHVPYIKTGVTDTTFKAIVDAIDEITIDGKKLRRIKHQPYFSSRYDLAILVERLGAFGQSIIGYQESPRHPDAAYVRCYKDNDIDTNNLAPWGFDCDEMQPLGISDVNISEKANVYPNPANDIISFELPENFVRNITYDIFNNIGIKIDKKFSSSVSGKNLTINISELPLGFYFICVKAESKNIVGKFIKK